MKKLLFVFFILTLSFYNLYAQTKTVKGKVIYDDFEMAYWALVMINDTVRVDTVDRNGYFQAEIPVTVNKISIWLLGTETANITLSDNCDEIEVVMQLSDTYDFMSLKKVDKERMKRFKKLPKLHKEAFEKGIFKTSTPCYTREFIPRYKKLQ